MGDVVKIKEEDRINKRIEEVLCVVRALLIFSIRPTNDSHPSRLIWLPWTDVDLDVTQLNVRSKLILSILYRISDFSWTGYFYFISNNVFIRKSSVHRLKGYRKS